MIQATLSSVLLAALAAPQSNQDQERFTTGPVTTGADRGQVVGPTSGGGGPPRPPDGGDIQANQNSNNAQNETSITVHPTDPDNWVGVGNDYRTGNVAIGWYTTLDGGATWVDGTFQARPGYAFAGDPCVTFDPNGDCHILGMQYFGPSGSSVFHYVSSDGGQTWSSGTEVDTNSANDKPQVAADFSGGPHHGDVTVAWNRFGGTSDVHVSTFSGGSWSSQQDINGPGSQNTISPDVTYGPNSRLYVMWADRGSDDIWVDVSTDGGSTWGADKLVSSFNNVPSPIPGSSFRMFDIFAIAADVSGGPYDGNVYVGYHHWTGGQADVRVLTSTDGGDNWSGGKVHNDTGDADQVFPGLHVDPHGNVHCVYYDRRNDADNQLLWTWVSRSSDGGATWVDHQVSDAGWAHKTTEFGGSFIGDYIDVDTSEQSVHPIWCEGRSGSQEIFVDDVNLAFYGDVATISEATGGQVAFTINIGPNHAGSNYWVLGTASGSSPGLTYSNGVHVPLNFDLVFAYTIAVANSAALPNTRGVLDGTGSASAGLDTLGPLPAGAAGVNLAFSVLISNAGPVFASDPYEVTIVP